MRKLLFRNNNVVFVNAEFSSVTASGFTVTGSFTDYKALATAKGFSLKKHSATTWTDTAVSASTYEKAYTSLDAATQYDIRMYVTVNNKKQYSAVYNVTTEAE